jgi:DNA-binding LacI/PurR family transcriptional regulator
VTTLREVAKRAGVSIATVSKVISNTPYVSDETKQRVSLAIEELGYVPNLAARALSKGRTHNICVVFPYIYDHLFSDPFVSSILEGIEAVATENGYNLILSTPRIPVNESEHYQMLIRSGYFDGAVVFETVPNELTSAVLERFGYPWIAIGYESTLGTLNTVCADDYTGAKALAAHMIALRHRHFGIISVEPTISTAGELRMNGYRAAFEEANLDFSQVPQVIGTFSIESGRLAAAKLLEQHPTPTALLCMNDRMALGAMEFARSKGLRIPDDLSVGGFDDIPMAQQSSPALTTVQQPGYDMGSEAVRLLFDLMDGRPKTSHKASMRSTSDMTAAVGKVAFDATVFPTKLIVRASSAVPPTHQER